MRHKRLLAIAAAAAANIAMACYAQEAIPGTPPPPAAYADLIRRQPPVTDADVTDRPYRIVGEIRADIRKATMISNEPSREKIFRELWERAERLGADAVVNARFGGTHIASLNWGARRRATGQAVKFLTDAEIAQGRTGERRPPQVDLPHND